MSDSTQIEARLAEALATVVESGSPNRISVAEVQQVCRDYLRDGPIPDSNVSGYDIAGNISYYDAARAFDFVLFILTRTSVVFCFGRCPQQDGPEFLGLIDSEAENDRIGELPTTLKGALGIPIALVEFPWDRVEAWANNRPF